MKRWLVLCFILGLGASPALAQQTGSISGQVEAEEGGALPGVIVEAASPVMPQVRTTVSNANGDYRLLQLPPGTYTLTYTLEGMAPQKREVVVRLQQNTDIDVTLTIGSVEDSIVVTGTSSLIDKTSSQLTASLTDDVIESLPVGQEYRDLVKLIPGVQYTEDSVRGPSAGGSGQDNSYQFDGVSVTLPLFGTLSAEPSSHDIEQIAVVKGGANAVDFNRSGGFSINSVSKSGTGAFKGDLSFQIQTDGMTGNRDVASDAEFEQDRDWLTASFGGPVVQERLYFYGSYYRPTVSRNNRSNLYGDVPNFKSDRDEFFGKLSFQPTSSILLNGSYRTSDRSNVGSSVSGESSAGSTSTGEAATLDIGIFEGTWLIDQSSFLSGKFTDFANETSGRPDNLFNFPIRIDGSVRLDVGSLDTQGLLVVPTPLTGQTAYNNFITPIIDRYGFDQNGVRNGGGLVGGGTTINDQNFFRQSAQIGYDRSFGTNVTHDVHVGYQWSVDEEDLSRKSNGWGTISVPGGRTSFNGQPIFYEARFEQQTLVDENGAVVPVIHSEFESNNIELNDSIKWNNWAFNVGVLLSNDILYGQGLRANSSNLSGFELSTGSKYKMYETSFGDMIQPRLGAVWAYNGADTVYANYAKYMPAASSLPRAASWARNSARTIRAYFDEDGQLFGVDPVASSSGKFFQDDLKPRAIDEYLIGTSKSLSNGWTARAHARYRHGYRFWEDTNNNARIVFNSPDDIPKELYISNLDDVRAEIGGSSYVIAELDGAFTKYWETGLETEWRGGNAYFRGSYVWSHYYGNFDQDNTSTGNDANLFIGSSNLADGAGRQIWDFKYGNLRGDRRHQLKAYGYYGLKWDATVGAYGIYQSGQPWEVWDVEVYRDLTSSSSSTNRYAEPAGSRTTSSHYQIDLNYTQNFSLGGRFSGQVLLDVFNALDNQTGYNVQNIPSLASFGEARSFYDPRRFQLAVKLHF